MLKFLLAALLLLPACRYNSPSKHYAYHIVLPDNISVWPIYCDSLRIDGPCATYYQDGRTGRICGNYTAYPQ